MDALLLLLCVVAAVAGWVWLSMAHRMKQRPSDDQAKETEARRRSKEEQELLPNTTAAKVARLLEERWTRLESVDESDKVLRVLTWNVLADAYASGQRHCRASALRFELRFPAAAGVLERSRAHVVLLQEVDRLEEWGAALEKLGYSWIAARRDRRCRDEATSPPDACVTAWRDASLLRHEQIDYDDDVNDDDRLARRYRRHNVGLVCTLERFGRTFVVSNTHAHWDPARADVKLAQLTAFLRATERIAAGSPVLLGGDWNSMPSSAAVRLAIEGRVRLDASACSPLVPSVEATAAADIPAVPSVNKVAIDFNLNRLCRWLRLCGVDAVLETDDQAVERCRSSGRTAQIAAIARAEGRLLVTASKTLAARREILSIPHVVVTSSMSCEDAFCAVVRAGRLDLDPAGALTRCVLCNGIIRELDGDKARDLRSRDVDRKLPADPAVTLYACSGCAQTFWWSDRGTSSAARAKNLADRLELLAKGVRDSSPVDAADDLIRRMVAGVDHGLRLRSVSPVGESRRGVVTNYVPAFSGQIDYIFYDADNFRLVARRQLPTVAQLKQTLGTRGYLPCSSWPSDHIPVVADLVLRKKRDEAN